jgi:hypothetical protein
MSVFSSISNRKWSGWFFPSIPFVLGIGVAFVLGLAWLGVPGFLTRWILETVNEGDYFITANHVRLDLRGGIKASEVMVYRKGITGPPLLETRSLQVLFHLFEARMAGGSRVKEVRARGGVIRPLWGSRDGAGRGGSLATESTLSSSKGVGRAVVQMDLDVTLNDFDVLGVWVEELKAGVQVDKGEYRLSRLSGRVGRDLQSGTVEGTLAWTPLEKATGRLVTSFDPHALTPVFKRIYPDSLSVLERFSFPVAPPRFDLVFETDLRKPYGVKVSGRMQASQYAYRGAGIGFANISGDYIYGSGTNRLKLDSFLIVVGGRKAEGKTEFNFASQDTTFEVISAIDMASVLRLAGVREQALESWQFEGGSAIVAKGEVNTIVPDRSCLEATVEGKRVGFESVRASDYAFRFLGRGQTNQFSDIRAKIGGGSFFGSVLVEPASAGSNRVTRARVEIIHVDVDELIKLISTNQAWRTAGKLYGNIEWVALSGNSGAVPLSAQGRFAVRNARIFRLPLFAGLTAGLKRFAPGVDSGDTPVELKFSFQLSKGRVESRDIQMDYGWVTLSAQGSCGLDGTLDFTVEAHLARKPGMLGLAMASLFPAGTKIEFKLGGTLESPQWRRVDSR